jgi:hypothetical protein
MSDWRKVLKALDELAWRGSPQTPEYVATLVGRDAQSVVRLLEAAAQQGYVERVSGEWWLTDRGRAEART